MTYKAPSSPEILTAIKSNIILLGHNAYFCRKLPTSEAIPHRAVILKFFQHAIIQPPPH